MKLFVKMLVLVAVVLLNSSFTNQRRWVIETESNLIIHGSTNVNSFKCMIDCLDKADTISYTMDVTLAQLKFQRNRLAVPIKRFNCGNKQITKDFLQTLKSDKYPHLIIHFNSFSDDIIRNNSKVEGVLDITLAGNTKQYRVHYYAKRPDTETILLTGKQVVNFADFKLQPPQKMMGLIQVEECLDVEFNLVLKAL